MTTAAARATLLAAGLSLGGWAAAADPPTQLRAVTVRCQSATAADDGHSPVRGNATLTPLGGDASVEARLDDAGSARIPVEPGLYRLGIDAPGYWAQEQVVEAGQTIDVTLYESGELAGRLKHRTVDANEGPALEWLKVRFRRPEPGATVEGPAGEAKCPITERGAFVCTLPALRLDLELRAPGHVPVYLWNRAIPPGKRLDLEPIKLETGASIAGWVLDPSAPEGTTPEVKVHLQPRTAATASVPLPGRTAERLRLTERQAAVGERGFFQVAGIAPGRYRVHARRADGAASPSAEVAVGAEREVRLAEPLVLRVPTRLEVSIDPPLSPADEPWQIGLSSLAEPATTRTVWADWGGLATFEDLDVGAYQLEIGVAGITEQHAQRWWQGHVEIAPPSTFVPVTLSWVEVVGELRGSDGPVAGALFFGGRYGVPRVTFETDADGGFRGALPHEGTWRVDFAGRAGDERVIRLEDVEVSVGPSGKALLDLHLSENRIDGRVVDGQGEPVGGAIVRALSVARRSNEAESRSEADGTFVLEHLRSGEVWVDAEAVEGRAAPVRVVLGDELAPEVELVLTAERELSGRVMAGGQAVAGALVQAAPVLPRGVPFTVARALSDQAGAFHLSLDGDADAAQLIIRHPGWATRWQRVELAALTPDAVFELSTDGGRLEVSCSEGNNAVLAGPGGEIGVGFLADRTERLEGAIRYQIDRLAAGAYRLCPVELPATVRWDRCRDLPLISGSTHTVRFEAEASLSDRSGGGAW